MHCNHLLCMYIGIPSELVSNKSTSMVVLATHSQSVQEQLDALHAWSIINIEALADVLFECNDLILLYFYKGFE